MDFHPNMLSRQSSIGAGRSANAQTGAFHPAMLSQQQLAGLDAAMPATATAPAPTAAMLPTGAPPAAFGFDASTGMLTIGGNQIKLVSAVLSAIAVKLVFFSGKQVAKGAKHLAGRFRGQSATPATATNPKSERPWQAVRFNPGWRKLATKRHRTKTAAAKWAKAHGGPGRTSYVG